MRLIYAQALLSDADAHAHAHIARRDSGTGAGLMDIDHDAAADEHGGEATAMASAAPKHEAVDAEEVAGLLQQLVGHRPAA